MTTYDLPPDLPVQRRRGCLFYGAITAVVFLLVVGVGGFFLVRHLLGEFVAAVEAHTERSPRELPPPTLPPEEYAGVMARVRAFGAELDAGRAPEPLVLTGEELDAWSRSIKLFAPPSQLRLFVEGDSLQADVSLRLEPFLAGIPGLSRLQGRYLNGHATLGLVLADGRLALDFQRIEVKGEDLPREVLEGLNQRDLLTEARRQPEFERVDGRITGIHIADGTITITGAAK